MTNYLSKEEYHILLDISKTINSSLDMQKVLDHALQQLARLVEANASSIWLVNESTKRLYVATATGERSKEVKAIELELGQGIAGTVVQNGIPIITRDARREKQYDKKVAEKLDFDALTMACVPICVRGDILGAIQAINKLDNQPFSDKDLFIMNLVADATGIALDNARLHNLLERENRQLRRELGNRRLQFRDLIGRGKLMTAVLDLSERVAQTNSTVLILGESGTGKELIAQSIHNASLRSGKPFIAVNCAALPDTLLESELFGHERGAFTGATSRKEGRFELANNGTIFLDEIGDMPTQLQAKLLRALQGQQIYRVGGTKAIRCDVRIIAATNQNIEAKMKEGTFRDDLYYRLNVITVTLPPLRDRPEDIPELIEHFLVKYSLDIKRKKSGFSREALEALQNYAWPGNVRELENAIEHAVVLGEREEVLLQDLPVRLQPNLKSPRLIAPESDGTLEDAQRNFKKSYIEKVLRESDGNRSKAAEVLSIQRTYLSRLIRELKIDS